jgi:Mrp family chromosome partitioning ATPase
MLTAQLPAASREANVSPSLSNLGFEAAAAGGEVLLVDADTYGGAVAQANIQQRHRC